jgi:hypothetical protein
MPGHARVHRWQYFLPLIPNLMQVRVANAAEQNLNLNVVIQKIAALDRRLSRPDVALAAAYAFAL